MLKDLLKSVEQEINSMEHKQARKESFYQQIDNLVINLLTDKLEGYTVYTASYLKGTDSERYLHIYQGKPAEDQSYWNWRETKPFINVYYKIKLSSIEVKGRWDNYKEYNLKGFSFLYEYDNDGFAYELGKKFEEINEADNIQKIKRNEQLVNNRENLINFLEDLKQAIINNEDIRITRSKKKDDIYSWSRNGVQSTEDAFVGMLKAYDKLMELSRVEQ